MPTPLDQALNSKNLFVGFAALVTAATAWSIWGQDMFPASSSSSSSSSSASSPSSSSSSSDPETWTETELRSWLEKRNLPTLRTEKREDLLARVQNVLSNLRGAKD